MRTGTEQKSLCSSTLGQYDPPPIGSIQGQVSEGDPPGSDPCRLQGRDPPRLPGQYDPPLIGSIQGQVYEGDPPGSDLCRLQGRDPPRLPGQYDPLSLEIQVSEGDPPGHDLPRLPGQYNPPSVRSLTRKTLTDFKTGETDTLALQELQEELNAYMLQKIAASDRDPEHPYINIQDYFSLTRVTHTKKSCVVYLDVLDAVADRKDTLMSMLHDLYQQLVVDQKRQWVVVEGDAKLYDILQSIKFEYGGELAWMVPYPGDWHLLKNYQIALMKPYYDAGLKALAKAAGYPLAAIKSCSQSKRTHKFLLEVWEAVYRVMLTTFLSNTPDHQTNVKSITERITQDILSLRHIPTNTSR